MTTARNRSQAMSTARNRSPFKESLAPGAVMAALLLAACGTSDDDASGSGSPGGSAGVQGSGGIGAAGQFGTGGQAAGGQGGSGGTLGPAGTGGQGATMGSGGASDDSGGSSGTGGASGTGGGQSDCSASTLAPGDSNRTIQVGGASRTFILHVPSSYTGTTPVPLVLDFHGLGGTGAGQRLSSGFAALSDRDGFVIAWPDGIDNAWNIGPCCTRSRDVDDLGFAKAIVTEVTGTGCIDRKRVYATGFSMGGGFSHFLACNAADVFAAVAPSAFDLLVESEEPCHPSRPVSVLSFRGTADFVVPYAGGASTPPNGCCPTIHFLGAEGTLARWAAINACTGSPTTTGNTQLYSQCADGVQVGLYTIQGGGHAPGPANTAWDFLKAKSLL